MSFEFKQDELVQRGARRIAKDEIADVEKAMGRHRRISHDKAVHAARKGLKRLRALTRIARDSIGQRAYQRENRAFRDAGRALSAARDARVLLDSFDKLLGEQAQREWAPAARRRLLTMRREALREHERRGGEAETLRALRRVKQHVCQWKFKHEDFPAIEKGLKRIFRQGQEAFETARHERRVEDLHEWRKRVKDLWHAAQLLGAIWPDVLGQLESKAHALSDCLGEDHDLAVLRQAISDAPADFGSTSDVNEMLEMIDARRRELQLCAVQLGERVYGETPGAFVQRMGWYWDAWRNDGVGAPCATGALAGGS
jgi:CHAD domain-containing protein